MKIIIDIGNSFIKFYTFDKEKIIQTKKSIHCISELYKIKRNIITKKDISKSLYISSVSNKGLDMVKEVFDDYKFYELNNEVQHPFKLNYKTPESYGKDRLAFLYYIYDKDSDIKIAIDFGTAITIDILIDSSYIGGHIVLSAQKVLEALGDMTSNLPQLNLNIENYEFKNIYGYDTNSSIIKGAYFSSIGLIKLVVDDLKKKHINKSIKIFATGGGYKDFTSSNCDIERYLNCNIDFFPNAIPYGILKFFMYHSKI